VNYDVTEGYIYLNRDSLRIQSTLGDLAYCRYEQFKCSMRGNGILIWRGEVQQACIFEESLAINGTNHGTYWLSVDHSMALSFEDSGWQPSKVCPLSRPNLSLIKSDQGIYVINKTDILNVQYSGETVNITVGASVSRITQILGSVQVIMQPRKTLHDADF